WELKMLQMEPIKAEVAHAEPAAVPSAAPTAPTRQTGFQRTEVNPSSNPSSNQQPATEAPAVSSTFANVSQDELSQRAADGLLINGSVNNGAASPFAQLGGFGTNRRGLRPLSNGGIDLFKENSALNHR